MIEEDRVLLKMALFPILVSTVTIASTYYLGSIVGCTVFLIGATSVLTYAVKAMGD